MTTTPLHDPTDGPLRVVGLMSGSGTNLRRIIEHERRLAQERDASPYHVVAIFSDRWKSQATKIGAAFSIPVVTSDIRAFYRSRRRPRSDMALRAEYDALTVRLLAPFEAKVAAYGGYMSIATAPLISAFSGVNVHPADLSIEVDGRRRFVGDHAVRDAIVAGESTLCSSTHIVEDVVDEGRLLMISTPIDVELPAGYSPDDPASLKDAEDINQERLKRAGDWVIFPLTVEAIADGRYAADEDGRLFVDGQPIPKGLPVMTLSKQPSRQLIGSET